MIPRVLIDRADIPGGGALRLIRRGDEFSIMLGSNELMNSRLSASEKALADLAIERMPCNSTPHILIGGLGMGFTLRAALAALGPDALVTVAELVPEVVTWARKPMAELSGDCLDDPRVDIRLADVAAVIGEARSCYDAILLDVDNGPDGITHPGNDRLYDRAGLAAAKSALRPGGILAIWSAAPDAAFVRRLQAAGFAVDEVIIRASGKGMRHVIWLAAKP